MERPLSPFMFPIWYRFQITSALSILHRLTGIALAVGSILLVWWLITVAAGGELFAATHTFLVSPIGLVLLFGWSIAFFYHLCNGVRHLAWDAGYGFEIRTASRSGYAVLAATVLLTAHHLALRVSRLGDYHVKDYPSIGKCDRTARRDDAPSCPPTRQRARWTARMAVAALDRRRADPARASTSPRRSCGSRPRPHHGGRPGLPHQYRRCS